MNSDLMTRRERVEATLNHQPVDRCAVLEQLSYNSAVIADWTGRHITGFDYTIDDICAVIRQTCDLVMPPVAPRGTARVEQDGFITQNDNWTGWHVSRPFTDEHGAAAWLRGKTTALREQIFDPAAAREGNRRSMLDLQRKIGDVVVLDFSMTGFCNVFDRMGLEIYSFFQLEYPEVLHEHMRVSTERELQRIHAVADRTLSPVILVPEDFSTKQGPIFSPQFLRTFHLPYIKQVTDAWHEHDIKVLYHSDGNYRIAIPDLMSCGVD